MYTFGVEKLFKSSVLTLLMMIILKTKCVDSKNGLLTKHFDKFCIVKNNVGKGRRTLVI